MIQTRKANPNFNPEAWIDVLVGGYVGNISLGKGDKAYKIVDVNGTTVMLRSGKSVWKSKGSARSALSFHLKNYSYNKHFRLDPLLKDVKSITDKARIIDDNPEIPNKWMKIIKKRFPLIRDFTNYILEKKILTIVEM